MKLLNCLPALAVVAFAANLAHASGSYKGVDLIVDSTITLVSGNQKLTLAPGTYSNTEVNVTTCGAFGGDGTIQINTTAGQIKLTIPRKDWLHCGLGTNVSFTSYLTPVNNSASLIQSAEGSSDVYDSKVPIKVDPNTPCTFNADIFYPEDIFGKKISSFYTDTNQTQQSAPPVYLCKYIDSNGVTGLIQNRTQFCDGTETADFQLGSKNDLYTLKLFNPGDATKAAAHIDYLISAQAIDKDLGPEKGTTCRVHVPAQ